MKLRSSGVPTENAVTDCNNGLITERRHGSETFALFSEVDVSGPNGKPCRWLPMQVGCPLVEPTLSANPGLTSFRLKLSH